MRGSLPLGLAAVLAFGLRSAVADEPPFELRELASTGRTVAAELADLNGDQRADLLQIVFVGYPPKETRRIRVRLQGHDGALPEKPSREIALPERTAAYDLADLLPEPGVELVLLRPEGLSVLSFAGPEPRRRELPVPASPTLASGEDERGLDRLRIARNEFAPEPWLFVPEPGRMVVLSKTGAVLGELEVGGRVNYLIPPRPGPVVFESEMQAFVDFPRLCAGDVNGDGRADLIASSRHWVRIFLQRKERRFESAPDRVLPLARISERDHIRATGSVRVDAADVNGDALVDLVVTHISGAFTDAKTTSSVHLNRGGSFDLDKPDQLFTTAGAWTTDQLVDLDGDGRPELVRVGIPFSLLELIEVLVTQELDARIAVHRAVDGAMFSPKPESERQLGVALSFDTFRPVGFMPTLEFDLNADGHRDLIAGGSGDRIEIYLGGPDRALRARDVSMPADSRGRVNAGDLDGDRLPDLVLYDPVRPGAPVFVARNKGRLPGAPARMRPQEGE